MGKKYRHLSLTSRYQISKFKWEGRSNIWISEYLGVSKSTIGRELKRNGDPVPKRHIRRNLEEQAQYMHAKAKKRKKESRLGWGKLSKDQELIAEIKRLLSEEHWSPEDIEHRIGDFFPDKSISGRGIRNYIKRERPEWKEYLYFGGKPRRQRIMGRRGLFGQTGIAKRSIHERPKEANKRLGYGHFEADTIHSRPGSTACVLTIRERKSRQIFTFILPDRTASTIIKCLLPFFQKLPEHMRKSLTVDNGPEFAELYKLEKVIPNFKVYFCDPYKAAQRGSNENGNGRVRRFFGKGTDFTNVSDKLMQEKTGKINCKPMRLHKWRSPDEVYQDALLKIA